MQFSYGISLGACMPRVFFENATRIEETSIFYVGSWHLTYEISQICQFMSNALLQTFNLVLLYLLKR